MSAWAKPGVKCVCISNDWVSPVAGFPTHAPVIGETYTVDRSWIDGAGEPVLTLTEVPVFQHNGAFGCDVHYNIRLFRPLVSDAQEADIALIKSLLVGDEALA